MMLKLIWLIPLLPLAGFLINGLLGRAVLGRRMVSLVACGVVLAAFLLSIGAVWQLNDGTSLQAATGSGIEVSLEEQRFEITLWEWLPAGKAHASSGQAFDLTVGWGFQLDPLSSILLLVVTGVGFLIHVYSVGYMSHEEGYERFFIYLNLFMAMMLTLVLASNFLVMFVGWEGVGLCSYLLIGFFYDRPFDRQSGLTCADAGRKAFMVNRIGDFGFLLGILLILVTFGTLDFSTVTDLARAQAGLLPPALFTLIALLLFVGATGKSAQIPLFVWLPDAMAGPTPVSALIHAATMVTAGVYMVCRTSALYVASPQAMATVATIGVATAIVAALMGLVQNDIKKVLAYSTISQLGFMFMAAGVGAFGAAMFHLMTHAFFKALLFLGAGAVIHSLSGEQDMRRMGGVRHLMPRTFGVMLVGTLAIAGVPGLAGFFSKDEILWRAYGFAEGPGFSGHPLLWGLGIFAAGLTAFYMFRLMFMVFWGSSRMTEKVRHHAHETPWVMLGPLCVLAALAVLGGYLGIPAALGGSNWLGHYLAPSFLAVTEAVGHNAIQDPAHHAQEMALEYTLMAVSVVVAMLGILLAWVFYVRRPEIPGRVAQALGGVYTLVARKFYVDEFYGRTVVAGYYLVTRLCDWFDRWIVDGVINLIRNMTVASAHISYLFDRFVIDLLVNATGWVTKGLFYFFRRLQTGLVQTYAAAMVLGVFVMVSLYLLIFAGN